MKTGCFVVMIALLLVSGSASARGHSAHGGAPHYVSKECKSATCFKKHPNGRYGFMTGKKKKK